MKHDRDGFRRTRPDLETVTIAKDYVSDRRVAEQRWICLAQVDIAISRLVTNKACVCGRDDRRVNPNIVVRASTEGQLPAVQNRAEVRPGRNNVQRWRANQLKSSLCVKELDASDRSRFSWAP